MNAADAISTDVWAHMRACADRRHASWGSRTSGEVFVCELLATDAAGDRRKVRQFMLAYLRGRFKTWKETGPRLDNLQHAVKNSRVVFEIVRLFCFLGFSAVVVAAADAMTTPKPTTSSRFDAACDPELLLAAALERVHLFGCG